MKKEEFIEKWKDAMYHLNHESFKTDLNALLAGKAEKQRKACANYYKSNCKDFDGYVYEVILHTPLTQITEE